MTNEPGFFNSRPGIQYLLVIDTILHIGINCEITDSERSQILKEVGSLTRVHTIISQPRLHNDTFSRNMGPLHRNAQPLIAASPASRTYQYIMFPFIQKFTVHLFYFISNGRIIGSSITICLHINHILNVLHNAMPQ